MRGNKRIKVWCLVVATILAVSHLVAPRSVQASNCPELRVVFARGSGEERWDNQNYLAYKTAIETKLKSTSLQYEFIDLDYPAVSVSDIESLVGAYFGAGEAYKYGDSVKSGVKNLHRLISDSHCPNTRYVVGGYSQGAMVVSGALKNLEASRLIYAATFGDPKIYLPEGAGIIPAACKGESLSDYRMYVPDCQAYKGMLGAYIPYEPEALIGKVGTWCNKRDIMCSSKHWDLLAGLSDHTAYVADDLYEDASRVIFDKICKAFGLSNKMSSPHDTVILIDSTASMDALIKSYKKEALRLAEETLAAGGRVALYDYRDYQQGYIPKQHCSFDDCTIEQFEAGLKAIRTGEGIDVPESLLASSLHIMKELEWKQGSTKSIVVLTDAGYHDPDYDLNGTTQLDVVKLSKQIDPVNFYIITKPANAKLYNSLAEDTDGKVVTNLNQLNLLTDYIMERYDALPRAEEDLENIVPELRITDMMANGGVAQVSFMTAESRAVVVLNDAILGITEVKDGIGTVTINELDGTVNNKLVLIPIGDEIRGEGVEVIIEAQTLLPMNGGEEADGGQDDGRQVDSREADDRQDNDWKADNGQADDVKAAKKIPKAPATGQQLIND